MSLLAATDYAQTKRAFELMVDLPVAARAAWLAQAGLDAAVAAEVVSLLSHHDQLHAVDEHAVDEHASRTNPKQAGALRGVAADWLAQTQTPLAAPTSPRLPAGTRLGAWAIERRIGAGGMGEVYEARRVDGRYEGRAAIKMLRLGLDSAAVLARFAHEQQALARLSHPNMARLLDAGVSASGAPYFVMELVQGQDLEQAAQGLDVPQRVRLFLQLADAVAYAHRNLLVHRDVKPGNVLVDQDGRIKLLDFGIAKALDPLEGESSLTHTGERPFTPQYASPEQLRGEPVTTATDQYSLGVLLYRMLTGQAPYARGAVSSAEVARAVQFDVPPLASASVLTHAGGAPVARQLRGDLDQVLAKALAKAVDDRYPSVEAMAADLVAWLEGRPVQARPASRRYVLGKWAQRNRWAVLAALVGALGLLVGLLATALSGHWLSALGLMGLAAGLVLALWQAQRARTALHSAERHSLELRRLSRDVVVQYGDAITHVPGGAQPQARMLRSTIACMEALLQADPQPSVALRAECAALHARVAHLRSDGEFNAHRDAGETEHHARRADALFQACGAGLEPTQLVWWARALSHQALLAQMRAMLDASAALHERAQAVLDEALGRDPASRVLQGAMAEVLLRRFRLHYGWDRPHRNEPEVALALLARALDCLTKTLGGDTAADAQAHYDIGDALSAGGLVHVRLERWDEAIEHARRGVEARRQAVALAPLNTAYRGGLASDLSMLAGLLLDVGDDAMALPHAEAAWQGFESLARDEPTTQVWPELLRFVAFNLARAQWATGQAQQALQTLTPSLQWLEGLKAQGAMAPRLQTRLARSWLLRASARHALGGEAGRDATAALALMHEAAARADLSPMQRREAWLVIGEAHWRAATQWQVSDTLPLRKLALDAYAQAEQLQAPLTALHASRAAWARGLAPT